MKAEKFEGFVIKTAYWKSDKPNGKLKSIKTVAEPLKALALRYVYDPEMQKGVWFFSMNVKDKVETLINDQLELEDEPPKERRIEITTAGKGEGPFNIVGRCMGWDKDIDKEVPVDCYVVEHLVYTSKGKRKLERFKVAFGRVEAVWNVINETLEIGDSAETGIFPEKLCNLLGIVRCNRDENYKGDNAGTFDIDKFRGMARERNAFWRVLRILNQEGQISYPFHSVQITKLKDRFDLQLDLPVVEMEDETE